MRRRHAIVKRAPAARHRGAGGGARGGAAGGVRLTGRGRPVAGAAASIAAIHVLAFWPGIMVWDAIRQYRQALSGRFDDWHPPAMNWLWRQLLSLHSGPAPMLVLQALLYWGGLGLLAADAARRGRTGLALAIGFLGLMPIPLVLVGTVLKDSLMAGALLTAAGLIAWRDEGDRRLALVAALLLAGAATLRFNAMPACLPLAIRLLPESWRRGRRAAAAAAIATALLLAMPLANRMLRAERSGVELSLVIYDLGGITRRTGTDMFPPLPVADPVATNARCYSPIAWDSYAWWVDAPCPIGFDAVRDSLRKDGTSPALFWARAAITHPLAYAGHRLAHFNQNIRFIVGGRAPHGLSLQSDPNAWGFAEPPNRLRDAIAGLAGMSLASPFGWPACWLAVAVAVLLSGARGDESLARPLAWSALLYGMSYLPLSVATEVRYHLWTTIAAALGAAMAVDILTRRRPFGLARSAAAVAPLLLVTLIALAARLF